MKFEDYKSGQYRKQYQYKSFAPSAVNHAWTWDDAKINTLLERATKSLSELNAFSILIPNVDIFIRMHIAKEATTSSAIEGTQTGMEEAVMDAEQIAPEKRNDWQEVQNYIHAMNMAIKELSQFPLSNRVLKNTHKILMQSVRGEHKSPGEFRASQNWIGGTRLEDAVFIPPHHSEVDELMGDLEKFWHNNAIDVPQLIRIAISHYQFETIHPFLDGNGRIGRLLITLFLVSNGFLNKPCLYVSSYLEKHRAAYYDALTTVRMSNNLIHWVKFFLIAVAETAEKGIQTFQAILKLKSEMEHKAISPGRRAESANKLIAALYERPIIQGKDAIRILGITDTAANRLLADFEQLGIIKEITGFKRNRLYVFEQYLRLFSS